MCSYTYLHAKQDSPAIATYYSVLCVFMHAKWTHVQLKTLYSLCCRQLIIEAYSQSPHCVRSEADNIVNVSNDIINQTGLTSLTEIDNLKLNEAYTMVMTCSTNSSYTVVKPTKREIWSKETKPIKYTKQKHIKQTVCQWLIAFTIHFMHVVSSQVAR